MGFDRGIARHQLPRIGFEEGEVLLQHEDVLETIVPGERRRDLSLRALTPVFHGHGG